MKPSSFILLLTLLAAAIPSHSSNAQKLRPPRDRIIIQIIELDYAEAEHLASVISPLLSPEGRVVAYPRTNTLIIKDKAYIVKRLVEIIKGPCDKAQEPTAPDICDED
jgi:general secretion pathway protein D